MEEFLTHGLAQLISAVGFPIVVAVAMYYQNNNLSASYQKLNQQLQEKLDNNTLILTRLVEKLHQDVVLEQNNTDSEKGDNK
jgi:CHASE3 domain sensor protein